MMRDQLKRIGLGLLLVALVAPAAAQEDDSARDVRTTIVPGNGNIPAPRLSGGDKPLARGDISLNFPGVSVQQVARAVLGDILHVPFSIDPTLDTPVTVVSDRPIARSAVMPFLEGAFRASGLAIINSNGTYIVTTVEQARQQAGLVGEGNSGFGNESFTLQFVSATLLQRVLETVLPGLVVNIDAGQNVLTIAGTTGQRSAVRDLVQRFDVNWLRNMSFALYVPRRTDARLIVPELEKLVDGPGAPTAGLVKLIAMDRLNGILAVSSQPQYLQDVQRWVDILDREGENSQPRIFVYRVQNGRSADLAKTILAAFGMARGGASGQARGNATEDGLATGAAGNGRGLYGQNQAADADGSGGGGEAMPTVGNGQQEGARGSGGLPTGMTITSDEANNAVVVYATPQTYAIIEDALRKLDIPPLQVLIEVAITEVSLNDELRYGVQWLFRDGNDEAALTRGTSAVPTRIFPGLSLGYSNGGSVQATLNALEGLTKVNVVSAPKLLVINNQTASLQVGDQVPISSSSAVSVQNPDAPIVNAIEYKDTGVILKITPRVNSGGLVLLDISQEVSDVSSTSTSNIDSPTISTRRLATSIAVQDSQTIALGGLIRAIKTQGNDGIPLLSRIPVLGALFGTKTQNDRRTELLIMLRPRVVRTVDDGRAITDELRDKIQTLKPGTRGADL
ncbi:general secretion pathway protein D [Sphingobium fontiphilum]|uniref:General secretion pathway protein D n=1 Tax=Sphingobium fontiphilum TaxID=944425 RepID=A0A7W6GLR5_9SPHN|nr:type II secretion system secretin GspD [Sphingobium fontiphilum]MBB3980446.1 general secretion pathway protein D [Sphingobium fontiphilum]